MTNEQLLDIISISIRHSHVNTDQEIADLLSAKYPTLIEHEDLTDYTKLTEDIFLQNLEFTEEMLQNIEANHNKPSKQVNYKYSAVAHGRTGWPVGYYYVKIDYNPHPSGESYIGIKLTYNRYVSEFIELVPCNNTKHSTMSKAIRNGVIVGVCKPQCQLSDNYNDLYVYPKCIAYGIK